MINSQLFGTVLLQPLSIRQNILFFQVNSIITKKMQNPQTESILQRYTTANQVYQHQLRDQAYKEIFTNHLNVQYFINEIPVSECQTIHTVFLPCVTKEKQGLENYYMGHGFGGTSVMNFTLIQGLLKKGNVIFWELRGQGFSTKLQEYNITQPNEILQFFCEGIQKMLSFYNHPDAIIISHSFSSYLLLAFILRRQAAAKKHIKEILLLSPVGITAKYQDYKFKRNSCLDFFERFWHKIIWKCQFNFKSSYRTLVCCCKEYYFRNTVLKAMELDQKEAIVMERVLLNFIQTKNGSQNLFFSILQPLVLPKIAMQPLFVKQPPIKITIVYGGDKDWVDKTGAKKLAERFPNKIQNIQIQNATHNVPFHTSTCKELFEFLYG